MAPETALGVLLLLMYAALGCVAASQLLRIVYYGHNWRSFQFAFVLVALVWAILRVVFFAQRSRWPVAVELAVYWLPTDLQFAMFSLIVVYFASLAYRHEWEQRRGTMVPLCWVANVFVVLLTAVYVAVSARGGHLTGGLDRAHHYFLAAQFFVLSALLALYGRRLFARGAAPLAFRRSVGTGARGDAPRLGLISAVLLVVFFSRFVYNLVAALGVWVITVGDDDGGAKRVSPGVFALFVLWEVLPPAMVLHFFRDIPRTRLGGFFCGAGTPGASSRGSSGRGGAGGAGGGGGGGGGGRGGASGGDGPHTPLTQDGSPPGSLLRGALLDDDSDFDLYSSSPAEAIREVLQPGTSPLFPSRLGYGSSDDDEDGAGGAGGGAGGAGTAVGAWGRRDHPVAMPPAAPHGRY